MSVLELKERSVKDEARIQEAKALFERELIARLGLQKVMAPLFVSTETGFNDDLNGVEKPVSFNLSGTNYQVVHSLAKWKRWCLGQLGMVAGEGIVTDMRAIRADEELSDIHAHLVDQWDWEKVIRADERTKSTLIQYGFEVYDALKITDKIISEKLENLHYLPEVPLVIHSQDLLDMYPDKSAKEREDEIVREYGAVLLLGIGGELSHGLPHDLRAPDYDDWITSDTKGRPGLNADLIVWDDVRKKSLEISSMGIRVDAKSMKKQLIKSNKQERMELPFHESVLKSELPLTIGGGIGQSRVAMFVNRFAKIKDVQPLAYEE